MASKKGFPDIVSILLAGGAKINLEDEDGRSALWWAASRGNERIIKLLHKKKARANSALSLFAVKGDLQSLETLFASGIPLEQTDTEGEPGLHIAARYGHLDIVKFYLNKGMDIHSTGLKGYTALHRASGYGQAQVAKYLLEQSSDPNWEGWPNLWTPVSLAARYGHLEILQMLYNEGGKLNQVTHKSWSPLMLAARGKHPLVVEYLLGKEVDTELQNHKRQTAKDIAVKHKKDSVIELLSDNAVID